MKAMILAAGEGTRLRPLTNDRPKPMLLVGGVPILEHNVRLLRAHGVTDVIINLHHQANVIVDYFGDGSKHGVAIEYSYEPMLLGTAGAVKKVAHSFESDFFIVYGDNLSECNLTNLMELHKLKNAYVTMALFHRDEVQHSGIVEVDDEKRIIRFKEKPSPHDVFSHWVNAGFLALSPLAFPFIPAKVPADFGHDVFAQLLQRRAPFYGYPMSEGLWWIDSLEDYERTRKAFERSATLS